MQHAQHRHAIRSGRHRGSAGRAAAWAAVAVSGIGALLLTALRVILMPHLRDTDTGRFGVGLPAVLLSLAVLAALLLLCRRIGSRRIDVCGRCTMPLALTTLLCGILVGLAGLWDLYGWAVEGTPPPPATAGAGGLSALLIWLCLLAELLCAAALIGFGLQISAEDGTRLGMSTWPLLAPVLWMWLRLARYEMSYASAVGLDECYYDFMMFILALLFLFKLARYCSGIGTVRPGTLLFLAGGTALFSLSGPLTRVCLYLLQDPEAYSASDLAGLPDLAIGAFALVFALSLSACADTSAAQPETDAPSLCFAADAAAPSADPASAPDVPDRQPCADDAPSAPADDAEQSSGSQA